MLKTKEMFKEKKLKKKLMLNISENIGQHS
jgi:hypothetical protein